jgi:peroxiredoxin
MGEVPGNNVPIHSVGVSIGQVAPDFTLPSADGSKFTLREQCAKGPVVLVFFPFAFTGVCRSELAVLSEMKQEFADLNTQVVAIACDSAYSLQAFAEKDSLTIPLLSDFWPHGHVATQYDVFLEDKGFATRGTYVIDRECRVRWSVINGPGVERDAREYLAAVQLLHD